MPTYLPTYPPYLMAPVAEKNGVGVFGFLVALVGLFIPGGVVSFLGMVISLVALGRAPRGFASMGVVLGLLGSALWLAIGLVALALGLVVALCAVAGIAAAFILTQPEIVEVTSDMVNVVIAAKHHQEQGGNLPGELGELGLGTSTMTDPWGEAYRFQPSEAEPGFDLVSSGRDGIFGTEDDIALSGLEEAWGTAFEDFEDKVDELGRKLDSLDQAPRGFSHNTSECPR